MVPPNLGNDPTGREDFQKSAWDVAAGPIVQTRYRRESPRTRIVSPQIQTSPPNNPSLSLLRSRRWWCIRWMASRANKYASLNFNDIYEKKIINPTNNKQHPSSSSQSSPLTTSTKTILSNSRIHGNMLVLTRPSPKPIPQPQSQSQSPPHPPAIPDQPRSLPDSISLRPLGRTGSGPSLSPLPLTLPKPNKDFSPSSSLSPSPSPKPNRFVPPHLRPGFVGREEKPGPELQKQQGVRSREFGGHFGSPNKHGEEGRPKSGGGYERMRRVGDSGPVEMNRPRSSGTRPSSSG